MTKKELLKQYPELIKEIAEDLINYHVECYHGSFFDNSKSYVDAAIKEPILVTEDGKSICDENQVIFCLRVGNLSAYTNNAKYCTNLNADKLYFSCESARQTYITHHKPLTSVKEQVEALKNAGYTETVEIEYVLTALAKSKL